MELRYWLVHGNVKNNSINQLNEKRSLIPWGRVRFEKWIFVLEFCGFPCFRVKYQFKKTQKRRKQRKPPKKSDGHEMHADTVYADLPCFNKNKVQIQVQAHGLAIVSFVFRPCWKKRMTLLLNHVLELELELYFYINTVNLSDKIIIIKITIYFTLYISYLRAFRVHLISLLASFVFDVLESSWTGISLWLIFEKRRNEVLSRVIFFWAGRKQKRVYVYKMTCFFHRVSFAIACWLFWLSCQDATWPAFVKYRLGKQLLICSGQQL